MAGRCWRPGLIPFLAAVLVFPAAVARAWIIARKFFHVHPLSFLWLWISRLRAALLQPLACAFLMESRKTLFYGAIFASQVSHGMKCVR
jgi:hypothetical protein